MIKLTSNFTYKNLSFWVTNNKMLGVSFYASPLDIESINTYEYEDKMQHLLKSYFNGVSIRVQQYAFIEEHASQGHGRYPFLKNMDEHFYKVVLHFEKSLSFFELKNITDEQKRILILEAFLDALPISELKSIFDIFPVKNIEPFFWDLTKPIVYGTHYIDCATELIGILKLVNINDKYKTIGSLSETLLSVPKPFEVHVQARKMDGTLLNLKLSNTKKREERSSSMADQTKAVAADEALAGIELDKDAYYTFEWHLILRRSSEEALRKDLKTAYNELSQFGEFNLETIGTYPSFMATQLGGQFHFKGFSSRVMEKDNSILCYLPVHTFGYASKEARSQTDLALLRRDGSVDYFNNFHPAYNNANCNIIGQSGKGKSVFLNRKIFCDAQDTEAYLIVVDVKGSHTRLMKDLGGEILHIHVNEPSGINPMDFLRQNQSEKILETVKAFLCELCLDDDEKKLSELDSSIIEASLMDFMSSEDPKVYTLDEFLKFVPLDFKRRALLQRFSEKGLLKNVFAKKNAINLKNIRYYNFKSIDTASNTALSKAIMAAIMADASFLLATKKRDQKLIFISDETPFFIKHCFRSFSLLSKNMRALNGSLVLTVQNSMDLIVDKDKSLIDSAVSTVFLSEDSTKTEFKERFNLEELEYLKISNLQGVQGKYSQMAIKDVFGCRVFNLVLSPKEYWMSTTKALEESHIEKLYKEFSFLTESQILDLVASNQEQGKHL